MADQEEIVQYLVFREDLKLSRGKTAAQAGHAVQMVLTRVNWAGSKQDHDWAKKWASNSITKIALQVPDLATLEELRDLLKKDGCTISWVVDAGRTETEPGTVTCMGLQPMPRSVAAKYVGSLPLLK